MHRIPRSARGGARLASLLLLGAGLSACVTEGLEPPALFGASQAPAPEPAVAAVAEAPRVDGFDYLALESSLLQLRATGVKVPSVKPPSIGGPVLAAPPPATAPAEPVAGEAAP
ncbi:MAG: hypothetical protein HXY25_09680, partial [Alphaproteobacteria bacterium]|nr:hypothetical protein [Alphaproteobacteria bacterium]